MLLEQLRSATRSSHAGVEAAARLLPEPTRDRYLWFLRKLYGFHLPYEASWDTCPALRAELGSDLSDRRRVPLLVRDLRALGVDPSVQPLCRSLPDLGSAARALGALYVTEGSTLGGQVLARRVGETLGIGPGDGAAFLTGRGAQTRPMWETLCALLEAFGTRHPGDVGELVASAVGCFEHLQAWLEVDA